MQPSASKCNQMKSSQIKCNQVHPRSTSGIPEKPSANDKLQMFQITVRIIQHYVNLNQITQKKPQYFVGLKTKRISKQTN